MKRKCVKIQKVTHKKCIGKNEMEYITQFSIFTVSFFYSFTCNAFRAYTATKVCVYICICVCTHIQIYTHTHFCFTSLTYRYACLRWGSIFIIYYTFANGPEETFLVLLLLQVQQAYLFPPQKRRCLTVVFWFRCEVADKLMHLTFLSTNLHIWS